MRRNAPCGDSCHYPLPGKTGPVNYQIRSHLDGRIIDAHRTGIKPAKIDEWYPPKDENERVLRKAVYVVPPRNRAPTRVASLIIPLASDRGFRRKLRNAWAPVGTRTACRRNQTTLTMKFR